MRSNVYRGVITPPLQSTHIAVQAPALRWRLGVRCQLLQVCQSCWSGAVPVRLQQVCGRRAMRRRRGRRQHWGPRLYLALTRCRHAQCKASWILQSQSRRYNVGSIVPHLAFDSSSRNFHATLSFCHTPAGTSVGSASRDHRCRVRCTHRSKQRGITQEAV